VSSGSERELDPDARRWSDWFPPIRWGAFIHILLVIAVVVIIVNLVQGRRVLETANPFSKSRREHAPATSLCSTVHNAGTVTYCQKYRPACMTTAHAGHSGPDLWGVHGTVYGNTKEECPGNAFEYHRTTPHRTHRLVTCGRTGSERRNRFYIEPDTRSSGCTRGSQQCDDRRSRWARRWSYVNGCRRVCIRSFPG
jgi:hypothetical protein